MPKTAYTSADAYIRSFPEPVQEILQAVRGAIATAVPEAEEVISYQIPAFRHDGWIFYYSAYKNHYSLSCPPPFTIFTAFAEELAPYEVSKSAIKFPLDAPVPTDLIARMARFRAEENLRNPGRGKRSPRPRRLGTP